MTIWFKQRRAAAQVVLAVAFALAGAGVACAGESLDGFWIDSDGEVILEIGPCGSARCGKVAWLRLPNGADGLPLLDVKNPDPKLRTRPVCGIQVVSGFKKSGEGTWGGGSVYVSDYGTTFSGTAQLLSPTQVKVSGYWGISLFGSSEVWTKVTKPVDVCWKAGPSKDAKSTPSDAGKPNG